MGDDTVAAPAVLSLPRGITGPRLAAAAGLGAVALVYAATFPVGSDGLILSDDGLNYAVQTQEGEWRTLFHPHHLLYHHLGRIFAWAAGALAGTPWAAALLGLRALSAVSGAVALAFAYGAVRRISGDRFAAALAAACLGAFSGFWYYSSAPESMAPAAAAMAGALWALAGAPAGGGGARACALAGLWHGAATLLRQDQILFVPAFLAHLAAAGRRGAPLRGAAYLVAYGLPVGSGYLLVYGLAVRGDPTYRSLWHWLTYYGQLGIWGQGGHPAWWSLGTVAERYLLGLAIQPAHAALLPGLLSLAYLAVAVREDGGGARARAWWTLAGVWVATAIVFYAWWDPSNAFAYMMGSLVPTALCLGLLVARVRLLPSADFRRYQRVVLASLVPALLWVTASGLLRPLRGTAYAHEAAVWYHATEAKDLILTNRYPLVLALRYTMGRTGIWLRGLPLSLFGGMDIQGLRGMVDEAHAAGRAVYLTQDVLDGQMILNDFAYGASGFERSYPVGPIHGQIWQVLGRYSLQPVSLGQGPRGPVIAWRLGPKAK